MKKIAVRPKAGLENARKEIAGIVTRVENRCGIDSKFTNDKGGNACMESAGK